MILGIVDFVRYIWDETKRLANIVKHVLDFNDAQLVLDGPSIHLDAQSHTL
jgi:uncharacterized DUF497 family protein